MNTALLLYNISFSLIIVSFFMACFEFIFENYRPVDWSYKDQIPLYLPGVLGFIFLVVTALLTMFGGLTIKDWLVVAVCSSVIIIYIADLIKCPPRPEKESN